jgi:hypothetical protein
MTEGVADGVFAGQLNALADAVWKSHSLFSLSHKKPGRAA